MDLEFEYYDLHYGRILLRGGIDLLWNDIAIEIEFDSPICINTILDDFTYDSRKLPKFIELATEDEIEKIFQFSPNNEYFAFKLFECSSTFPIWIVAKSITYKILKYNELIT